MIMFCTLFTPSRQNGSSVSDMVENLFFFFFFENLIIVGKRAVFTPDDKFLRTENIVCVHSHWPSNLKQNTQHYLCSFVGGGGGKGGWW